MKNRVCESYCGVACVDGRCPIALYYEDSTMFETKPSCKDCFHYKGCEDCAFKDMHLCPKCKKESEDTKNEQVY